MSSIPSGFGPVPIASSVSGIPSAGKQSSTEKSISSEGSAGKVVESAKAETLGLMGSEKTADRDADGRQHDDVPAETAPGALEEEPPKQPPFPRSKDPNKTRGNRLDLDA